MKTLLVSLACALAFACSSTSSAPSDAGATAITDATTDVASDAYQDTRTCKTTASVDENDWIEAKNERCCGAGLVFTDPMHTDDAGTCQDIAPPSVKLCTFCGDGTCTPPENACNCTADCH